MSMKLQEILDGINDMPLYDRDYVIINTLLSMVNEKLFTKIVEEVLEGNLYWSDFEKLLSNTNYAELLSKNLSLQDKLQNDIAKLIEYRENLYGTIISDSSNQNAVTNIGMSRPDKDLSPNQYEMYSREYEKIRDNILYELTRITPNDNELSIACKIKLESAIRNGKILLKKIQDESLDSSVEVLPKEIKVTRTEGGETVTESYDYINPDDIFFFIGTYILPIDYNRQILNSFDRDFMLRNDIKESEMKQIKSLSLFLKREIALNKDMAAESGGE